MTDATGARPRSARILCAFLSATLLAACTRSGDPTMGMVPPAGIGQSTGSVRSVLPPTGMSSSSADSAGPLQPAASVLSTAAAAPTAGREAAGPIQFLPVVGAPAQTVERLSEALGRGAAERGISILPSDSSVAPLRLKGYLSALGEGRETVVVYVWDVVDPEGNRVNRIQGQQRVRSTGADPWDAVDAAALSAIAAETLDTFLRQRSTSG